MADRYDVLVIGAGRPANTRPAAWPTAACG